MASILDNHPNPIPLPRLSLAAIALAVALACLMASVVGIAAWTIHSGPGITRANLAAAQKSAYANGHDAGLRARNPEWGVRDVEAVMEEAGRNGLALDDVVEMPANNLSVIFRR